MRVVAAVLVLAVSAATSACTSSATSTPRRTTPARASRSAPPVVSYPAAGPIGLTVAAGQVWTASADSGTVVGRDIASGRVTRTVAVGTTPLRVIGAGGLVWVSVFGLGRVRALDPATGRLVRDVPLAGQPEGLATGFGGLWVVRQQARLLTEVGLDGHVRKSYPLGSEPRLVTTTARFVVVSDFRDGTLVRVDPRTGRRTVSARLCDGPQGMAALGHTVWVACTTAGRLLAVDEDSLRVSGQLAIGGEPDTVRAFAGRLFVAATLGPTAYELSPDPAAPTVLRRRGLGHAFALHDGASVDLTFAGGRVWVSSYSEGRIAVTPW